MFHSIGTIFGKYIYQKLQRRDNWVMSGLYISEIAFLQLIGSCCRVIGMCIDVVFSCRFCGMWMREYFCCFILRNLLILTIIEVIVGR